MNKIKVLLVDDHAIMRDGIRALLGIHDDIEIIGEASEGHESIEKAKELAPDIIIMDIAMNGMDGLEATKHIIKESPQIKVLILTQYDDRQYILSAVEAGVAGYIPKKALGSELASAIRAIYRDGSYLYPSAAAAIIKSYRQNTDLKTSNGLTQRETQVLKLIAKGHTSREIAGMFCVSPNTVIGHRAKLMTKLDLHNRADLVKYAISKGLIKTDIQ